MTVEWILEGLVLGIICLVGLIGNTISVYIFYSKSYGPSGERVFDIMSLNINKVSIWENKTVKWSSHL